MPTCEISTSWMRKASSTCSAASSCDTVQGTMLCERLRCRGWGEGRRAAVSDRLSPAQLGSAQPSPAQLGSAQLRAAPQPPSSPAPPGPTCFFSACAPVGELKPPGDCV